MTVGRGILQDVKLRIPAYASDWIDGFDLKVLSSTFFIFFTSIGPAITFSLLLSDATEDEIGAIEVLVATSITGILFALCAGQPLVIVGVTGPVSILTISIYTLSEQWGIKFLPFYAWSQIWGALMLMVLAFVNACDALKHVTRFSCEIFGILIALLYLYTGIEGIVRVIGNLSIEFASGLLQFIIAIGTVYSANFLSHARTWTILNETVRDLVSDYGATLSILLWSIVPVLTNNRLEEDIPTLFVPLSFKTTSGRDWLVDITDIPVWGVFAAIFPGLIITVLFFFDHNVSSLLAQESEMKLRKGSAFHLDFLVLGIGVLLTGLLGIPPTNGLIPQAPLHTKSLMSKKRVFVDGEPTEKFEVDKVHEQRVSNLCQSFLCGLVCFRPFSDVLREIPKAVLYGLFLFLGASSFEDNEFSYRMQLLVMDPALRKSFTHPYAFVKSLEFPVIQKYTIIQMVMVSIIFVITFTPAGVIFPVLIAMLIWIRLQILPKLFTDAALRALDSHIIAEVAIPPTEDEVQELERKRVEMEQIISHQEHHGELEGGEAQEGITSSNDMIGDDAIELGNSASAGSTGSSRGNSRSRNDTSNGISPSPTVTANTTGSGSGGGVAAAAGYSPVGADDDSNVL